MSVSTIHDILAQFRDEELHNRHLGDRFSNIWMWNEWPKKGNSGDTGIDIVAEECATGEYCGNCDAQHMSVILSTYHSLGFINRAQHLHGHTMLTSIELHQN